MSPGTYLRLRREAAGVPIAVIDGIEDSLVDIEGDAVAITVRDAARLRALFAFDSDVLGTLILGEAEPLCRLCACSTFDPCREGNVFCGWAEPDLCTRCKIVVPA